MSNFSNLDLVTETLIGSAPSRFAASTPDSYATITAPGYLNDIAKQIKANDSFDVNYADQSAFPLNTGEASLYATFIVQYDPVANNWNLIPRSVVSTNIGAYGVHATTYSYAGGSATFTITDPAINVNSVVVGRFKSSANAVVVETVTPANGSVTIVASGNPGASVFEYISILPSVALQNQGVIAGKASNAGASATIVISNPSITAAMVVNANFSSQASASKIESVTASAGAITIVCSAAPGACVIEYTAVTASSALTALGFYAAQYSNAGGSATTSITDSNITASSIVSADWSSQANGVQIEKVTPGAGTLTILSSGDPGVSVLNYTAASGDIGGNASSLEALGIHSAVYSNAGGSATTTISDSKITAGSVVTANWATSANAVTVEKVTPGAGSLTILSSGDPGASTLAYIAIAQAE